MCLLQQVSGQAVGSKQTVSSRQSGVAERKHASRIGFSVTTALSNTEAHLCFVIWNLSRLLCRFRLQCSHGLTQSRLPGGYCNQNWYDVRNGGMLQHRQFSRFWVISQMSISKNRDRILVWLDLVCNVQHFTRSRYIQLHERYGDSCLGG
jgi:hypothetical protein